MSLFHIQYVLAATTTTLAFVSLCSQENTELLALIGPKLTNHQITELP